MGVLRIMDFTAVLCENCNAPLGEWGPVFVWYQRNRGDVPGAYGYSPVRGCGECVEEGYSAERKRRGFTVGIGMRLVRGEPVHGRLTECATCMRPISVLTDTHYRTPYTRPLYCSEECRNWRPEKVCEVCGSEFVATRADAKTCSPKCRQAAYRRRKLRS